MSDNLKDFTLIINSRFPVVEVETGEEVRMMKMLERAASDGGGDKESSGANCAASTLGNDTTLAATTRMQRLIGGPVTM